MQKKHFFLLKKFKNTESAQLCNREGGYAQPAEMLTIITTNWARQPFFGTVIV